MGRLSALLFAALAVWAASVARAEPVEFPSTDGKLQLQGEWYPVAADAGPRPAVLQLHGCNGMRDAQGRVDLGRRRYAAYFNAEGMHTLVLDSFGPRGLKSICEIPERHRTVNDESRREDVFAALRWLAAQPGVDAGRLVVVGWSHGAQAVLRTLDATDDAVKAQALKPFAAIAFYPGCATFNRMFRYSLSAPLLVMIGEADDWTPSAACVALHSRVGSSPERPFELVTYPGAYHGFDGTAPVTLRQNVGNTRSGTATVGGDPQARAQSHARLFEFLAKLTGRPLLLSHDERLRLRAKPVR